MDKPNPPRWANRFLEWYCLPERLDEIQGDAMELYYREAGISKRKADWKFVWNVIRFFRWRNINKRRYRNSNYSADMLHNIFKVALRNFFRQPGHSTINVLGLTMSFVAAFLITLWVFHEKSFDRFHHEPQRIFQLLSHVEADGKTETYRAARGNINFESIPGITEKTIVMSGSRWPNELCFRPAGKSNECIYVNGIYAEKGFFSIFNFPIVSGDQNPLSNPSNIAISSSLARNLYGDENPVGKAIKIDDYFEVTISSVFADVPSNSTIQFNFVGHLDLFSRMRGLDKNYLLTDFLPIYFRTDSDIAPELLNSRFNHPSVLTNDLKRDRVSYSVYPLVDERLHGQFNNGKPEGGRIQYVNLFVLVAIVLVVMAVINFVNLNTARAASRSREIGIRKVTGAQRSSILVQFMGEALLVVAVAVVLAGMLTQWLLPAFNSMTAEKIIVTWSGAALGWLMAFLVVVSFAAGLYPSLVMSSFQPARVLKGTMVTGSTGATHLRKLLLVVQISVSVGIVIFTGVIYQQLNFIQDKNLGFDRSNALQIEPTYKLLQKYDAFKTELLDHPEIEAVATTNAEPVNVALETTGVSWPGMPDGMRTTMKLIGSSYEFPQLLGLQLQEGRFFDAKPDSLQTGVLVTQEAVKRMSLKDPVGTEISIGDAKCTIIGVVNDFHTESLKKLQQPVIIYPHPVLQSSRLYVKFHPGTTLEAMKIIQSTYKKFEPAFTMKYSFMDETFNAMYTTERAASTMLILFTGLSLLIAVIGVVGLATYNVIKRRKEIGIKRVFGASVIQILRMLSGEFMVLISIASVIGMPLAWYGASQWLSDYAYRIPMPWWIFAVALLIMLIITLALIALQGLKTIRTNPVETLRNEAYDTPNPFCNPHSHI